MGDLATVTASVFAYTWQVGSSIWRLLQAVGTFNYHLISSLFKFVAEGCHALSVIASSLGSTVMEIAVYVFEFMVEVGRFISVFVNFLSKLLILCMHLLISFYGVLEEAAIIIAQMLTSSIRWMFVRSMEGLESVGLSSQSVVSSGKKFSSSCFNGVSSSVQQVQHGISSFTCAVGYCISSACVGAYMMTGEYAVLMLKYIQYAAECAGGGFASIGNRCWDVFSTHIPNNMHQIKESVDVYHDFSILIVIVVTVILFVRMLFIMRRNGLTVPFLAQPYSPSGINHIILDPFDDREAQIFVSDDEELGDTLEGEMYEDVDDSDDGESSVRSTWSSQYSRQTLLDDSDTDSDLTTSVDEFEVVEEDSDFESGDENDQNVINVQLPDRSKAYGLRSRVTPSPARSVNKFDQADLARYYEKERDKRLCVVCQDQVKNVLVLPCKHMCMCVDCAHAIVRLTNRSRRVCPLCRGAIDTVMNVFL